jgi:acyl carrier protein phosphodiesterase
MNFLAHLFLSGEDEELKFGNFIGDWVKGHRYESYPKKIKEGILLHREIDHYTDHHPVSHKSIVRLRPAYGKHAGVSVDILYDHFLAINWSSYSDLNLEEFVDEFHKYVLKNLSILPDGAKRFAFPFIRNKRLLCYADLECYKDVLEKMAIYTSMPDRADEALEIIKKNYSEFEDEFFVFFKDLQGHVNNILHNV